jgi:hypothetical protein
LEGPTVSLEELLDRVLIPAARTLDEVDGRLEIVALAG